jgi:hypothetical protein
MPASAAVRALLGADVGMQSLGFSLPYIFEANSADSPPRDVLWMAVHWGDISIGPGKLTPELCTIWVYQPEELGRYYGTLNNALLRIREVLEGVEHETGADGWVLTAPSWQGNSRDLFDEGYRALAKSCAFRVATRNIVSI